MVTNYTTNNASLVIIWSYAYRIQCLLFCDFEMFNVYDSSIKFTCSKITSIVFPSEDVLTIKYLVQYPTR